MQTLRYIAEWTGGLGLVGLLASLALALAAALGALDWMTVGIVAGTSTGLAIASAVVLRVTRVDQPSTDSGA